MRHLLSALVILFCVLPFTLSYHDTHPHSFKSVFGNLDLPFSKWTFNHSAFDFVPRFVSYVKDQQRFHDDCFAYLATLSQETGARNTLYATLHFSIVYKNSTFIRRSCSSKLMISSLYRYFKAS